MIVTAKDLRFKITMLFDILSKGEDIIITYRGKPKARLSAFNTSEHNEKSSEMFGMLKDETKSVDETLRTMRSGRNFDI